MSRPCRDIEHPRPCIAGREVSDVVHHDGNNRADVYIANFDGSYISPAGFFTRLVFTSFTRVT